MIPAFASMGDLIAASEQIVSIMGTPSPNGAHEVDKLTGGLSCMELLNKAMKEATEGKEKDEVMKTMAMMAALSDPVATDAKRAAALVEMITEAVREADALQTRKTPLIRNYAADFIPVLNAHKDQGLILKPEEVESIAATGSLSAYVTLYGVKYQTTFEGFCALTTVEQAVHTYLFGPPAAASAKIRCIVDLMRWDKPWDEYAIVEDLYNQARAMRDAKLRTFIGMADDTWIKKEAETKTALEEAIATAAQKPVDDVYTVGSTIYDPTRSLSSDVDIQIATDTAEDKLAIAGRIRTSEAFKNETFHTHRTRNGVHITIKRKAGKDIDVMISDRDLVEDVVKRSYMMKGLLENKDVRLIAELCVGQIRKAGVTKASENMLSTYAIYNMVMGEMLRTGIVRLMKKVGELDRIGVLRFTVNVRMTKNSIGKRVQKVLESIVKQLAADKPVLGAAPMLGMPSTSASIKPVHKLYIEDLVPDRESPNLARSMNAVVFPRFARMVKHSVLCIGLCTERPRGKANYEDIYPTTSYAGLASSAAMTTSPIKRKGTRGDLWLAVRHDDDTGAVLSVGLAKNKTDATRDALYGNHTMDSLDAVRIRMMPDKDEDASWSALTPLSAIVNTRKVAKVIKRGDTWTIYICDGFRNMTDDDSMLMEEFCTEDLYQLAMIEALQIPVVMKGYDEEPADSRTEDEATISAEAKRGHEAGAASTLAAKPGRPVKDWFAIVEDAAREEAAEKDAAVTARVKAMAKKLNAIESAFVSAGAGRPK